MSVFAAKSIFFCAWPPRDMDEVFTSSTINPSTAIYRKPLLAGRSQRLHGEGGYDA
jgi:hypothetical protein